MMKFYLFFLLFIFSFDVISAQEKKIFNLEYDFINQHTTTKQANANLIERNSLESNISLSTIYNDFSLQLEHRNLEYRFKLNTIDSSIKQHANEVTVYYAIGWFFLSGQNFDSLNDYAVKVNELEVIKEKETYEYSLPGAGFIFLNFRLGLFQGEDSYTYKMKSNNIDTDIKIRDNITIYTIGYEKVLAENIFFKIAYKNAVSNGYGIEDKTTQRDFQSEIVLSELIFKLTKNAYVAFGYKKSLQENKLQEIVKEKINYDQFKMNFTFNSSFTLGVSSKHNLIEKIFNPAKFNNQENYKTNERLIGINLGFSNKFQ